MKRTCRVLLLLLLLPFSFTSLFAVILLLLVIRGLPRIPTPLYSPPSCLSLSAIPLLVMVIPARSFFFWLSSSCVALFGAATKDRPTDRPTDRLNSPGITENIALVGSIFNYYVMLFGFTNTEVERTSSIDSYQLTRSNISAFAYKTSGLRS